MQGACRPAGGKFKRNATCNPKLIFTLNRK